MVRRQRTQLLVLGQVGRIGAREYRSEMPLGQPRKAHAARCHRKMGAGASDRWPYLALAKRGKHTAIGQLPQLPGDLRRGRPATIIGTRIAGQGVFVLETRRQPGEDWTDESFIEYWLQRESGRAEDAALRFKIVRGLIPRTPDETFRYINIAGGDGPLDEVLLTHFTRARVTLVDGSETMVAGAQKRLQRFGDRFNVVRADLSTPDWRRSVEGPFDIAVSTIAIHNLRQPGGRVRDLYAEIFELLSDGGFFLNLDYARPMHPVIRQFQRWVASTDPDPRELGWSSGGTAPGSWGENLIWLSQAGFFPVDIFWKSFGATAMGGFKGTPRVPQFE